MMFAAQIFLKLKTAQGDLKIKEVFTFQVKQARNKQTPPYEYLTTEMFDPGYSPFHQPVIHPMLPQYGNQSVRIWNQQHNYKGHGQHCTHSVVSLTMQTVVE